MEEKQEIGKICFYKSKTLEYSGSFGKTFQGMFEGTIDVAVKRLKKKKFDVDLKAIRLVDNHQHVLRCHCSEQDIKYMFIAFELTAGTLKDLVRDKYSGPPVGDWRLVLKQITSGLDHLHKKQVIHSHLKPSNIFISFPDGGILPLMKLANFGILRRANSEDGNTASLWKLGGSKGWLPAEAYIQTQFTAEMDFYALGLVYGYSLSKGCHPFGEDKDERIVKMKKSEPMTLTANQLNNLTDPEKVIHLITRMLSSVPNQRPSASNVLKDDFFNPTATAASDLVVPQPPEPEVTTTSRKTKQEMKNEAVFNNENMSQTKRAKHEETPVLPERPLLVPSPDSSEIPSSGSEPVTAAGAETHPESSEIFYSFTDNGDSQISEPEERIERKEKPPCSALPKQGDATAGTSIDDVDGEYIKLRADFESAEAYGRYVRKRIKEGMLIRCCESVESIDLFYGQTGTVVAVNRDIEMNLQVKWDGVQTPSWCKYQNVEILEDPTEMSESDSSPAGNLQPEESGDEGFDIETLLGIKSEGEEDQEANQTASTPPVEATESAAVTPGNVAQSEQESMGGTSGSIAQGIVTSSTLDISLVTAATDASTVKRHDYVSQPSVSSTAAEGTIDPEHEKSAAVPSSQPNLTRSSSLKELSICSSDKTDKKTIRRSHSPPFCNGKINSAIPVLKSPVRSPTATSRELVPFVPQSVATESEKIICSSSSPRTLTKRPICYTISSSDSEEEEQAKRVSKKKKQLSFSLNSSSSSIQPSNMRENSEDDSIPSTSLALRTTPSSTRSPLHKNSPSKHMNEFLQILTLKKANNKDQQVFQFLQNHPSVAKVLAVYEPQSEKNVSSKNSNSDVLSAEDDSWISTHPSQSSQKSSNPRFRVTSATNSPAKNEESGTSKKYETREAYSVWVQERLNVGSRVRISHDILEGEKGDTGMVLQIDAHDRVTDSNVMVDWGEKGIGWVRYFEIVILPDFTYEDDGDDHISVSSNDKEESDKDSSNSTLSFLDSSTDTASDWSPRPGKSRPLLAITQSVNNTQRVLENSSSSGSTEISVQRAIPSTLSCLSNPFNSSTSNVNRTTEKKIVSVFKSKEKKFSDLCCQTSLTDQEVMRFQNLVADKRVDVNLYSSKYHSTAILLLCRYNNSHSLYPCLKSLLTREDIKLDMFHYGKNPLMLLCRYYKLENELLDCIRLLIKRGVDCNRKSGLKGDVTALFLLSKYARRSRYLIDAVRLLINDKSDLKNAEKSVDVLQKRGFAQEADILSQIIQSYRLGRGSIPNKKESELLDLCSRSSLHQDQFNRFAKLAMDKAVNINCLNESLYTPLLLVCRRNKSDTLIDCINTLLKRHSVDVSYQVKDGIQKGLNALIAVCISYQNQDLVRIIRLLLERGIDIDAIESESHWNALFAVCCVSRFGMNNVAQVVQVLLDAGADVNTEVKDGSNCLIAWTRHNHGHPDFIPVLRLLIQRGIDLSCTDDQNRNALLIICELYNGPRLLDIVRLLVESHIDVHVRDESDRNVIDILENRGFQADSDIINFLKEAMRGIL